ncbi:hypothetical protein EDD17DRAFT_1509409 [Pisolithus thermaeus]|nr:hypothetical protein EV401DRAFT_1884041 [Pisolithus croceorrhizus]KAI6161193.1 hypothetical protein EDD17DRAFT_1509409 [Pisolithus thermaeus]
MCNATIPTLPACMPSLQSDRMAAMRSVAVPIPPVASAGSLPKPPLLNNLERMKVAVILIPPSAATAPNTDRLERMHNAVIQVPLVRIEMMDEQLQPPALTGGNVDHPHQSTSIEVVDGQTQPSTITGDVPTPDEHQALEQAGLATSDSDDDFLRTLQTFKLWHGADFPPAHFPYNKQLNRHIMQVMRQLAADIRHVVSSQVQNVQAGQYTVDMIDLLEVSCHPHVGYSLQPYTRGPPYLSRQSAIEMAIVYLGCCIECAVIHLLGWYANLCLDMVHFHFMLAWIKVMISGTEGAGTPHPDGSLQYTADFEQMRGARIFPIAHEYFQRLSMGDWIDEWMEEKSTMQQILQDIMGEGAWNSFGHPPVL